MSYYAALVSLIQLLKEINHPEHPYSNTLREIHQIHASLYEKFNLLQELLEYYSPNDHQKESTEIMERRIRDAAFQTQDVIESHIPHQIPQLLAGGSTELTLDNIVGKEYYEELERVKEEVDSIVEEMMRIELESHIIRLVLNSCILADSTEGAAKEHAHSVRNTMVGVDEQLMKIKAMLCGESSKLEVVSIVGMGGMGKTTLARKIFDDKLICDHFDCRAWVTISQDYNLRSALLDIGNSMNIIDHKLRREGEEVLKEHLYKHFYGRRYLIIMDDMWETKVWDDLRRILPDDSNGSRIIITSRLSDVADYAGTCGLFHQMQFLNENESWNLLCRKVICPPELEDIGRLIAKNCRGLPLAIVVIAGLLSKASMTRYAWEIIAGRVRSASTRNDEHFSNILYLSYNHLPHHLKPCFLYLGGFPEDKDIPVSKLIKLWVAEGFLKAIESKSLEQVAEVYLEDLVSRNLVLITKRRSNGRVKYCSIHDVLRDLCLERAYNENFLHFLYKKEGVHPEVITSVHRLYVHQGSLLHKYRSSSHVRSILFYVKVLYPDHILSLISGSKLLRVLDALEVTFYLFPAEIMELSHIRYLAFRGRKFHFPPSIFKLQNLQTLIVEGEASLTSEIWKMPHLRHVMIHRVTLAPIPYGEWIVHGVPLPSMLQTLYTVVDFRFNCDTVQMIPNLRKLKVEYTHQPVENWMEFGLDTLIHFNQLESMKFLFSGLTSSAVPLPEKFAFPQTLKQLTLSGGEFPWGDMVTVGSLPNLEVLKLQSHAFAGEEWEPTEGEFISLKFLLMEMLPLKYWRAEDTHFPQLEHLKIIDCWPLEEIPLGLGDIPTLQLIEVHDSKLAAASALKIQAEQMDLGNDDLQVRIYHSQDWS